MNRVETLFNVISPTIEKRKLMKIEYSEESSSTKTIAREFHRISVAVGAKVAAGYVA